MKPKPLLLVSIIMIMLFGIMEVNGLSNSTSICTPGTAGPPVGGGQWNITVSTRCTGGRIDIGNFNISLTNWRLDLNNIELVAGGINISGTTLELNIYNSNISHNVTGQPFHINVAADTSKVNITNSVCYNCTLNSDKSGIFAGTSVTLTRSSFKGGLRPFLNFNGGSLKIDTINLTNMTMGSGTLITQLGNTSPFIINGSNFYADNASGTSSVANYGFASLSSATAIDNLRFFNNYLEGFAYGIQMQGGTKEPPVQVNISGLTCWRMGTCLDILQNLHNFTFIDIKGTNLSGKVISMNGFGGREINGVIRNIIGVNTTQTVSIGRGLFINVFNVTANVTFNVGNGAIQFDQTNNSAADNISCYQVDRVCVQSTEGFRNNFTHVVAKSNNKRTDYSNGAGNCFSSMGGEASGGNITFANFDFDVEGCGFRFGYIDGSTGVQGLYGFPFWVYNGTITWHNDSGGHIYPTAFHILSNATVVADNIYLAGCKTGEGDNCMGIGGSIFEGSVELRDQSLTQGNYSNIRFGNVSIPIFLSLSSNPYIFTNISFEAEDGNYFNKVYLNFSTAIFINVSGLNTTNKSINLSGQSNNNGTAYILWFIKVNVTYSNGTVANLANVSFFPAIKEWLPFTYQNVTTDATGLTSQTTLPAWKKNNTGTYNYTNYTIQVDAPNAVQQNFSRNFISSTTLLLIMSPNSAPSLFNITFPVNNSYLSSGVNVWVNWSCTDPDGDACTAFLFLNGSFNQSSTVNFSVNLSDGLYLAKILTGDGSLNASVNSSEVSFVVDSVFPVLSNVAVDGFGANFVDLNFTVNELTNYTIRYNYAGGLVSVFENSTAATGVRVKRIVDLSHNTVYSVNISVCDLANNCVSNSSLSFRTDYSPSGQGQIGGGGGIVIAPVVNTSIVDGVVLFSEEERGLISKILDFFRGVEQEREIKAGDFVLKVTLGDKLFFDKSNAVSVKVLKNNFLVDVDVINFVLVDGAKELSFANFKRVSQGVYATSFTLPDVKEGDYISFFKISSGDSVVKSDVLSVVVAEAGKGFVSEIGDAFATAWDWVMSIFRSEPSFPVNETVS